MKTIGSFITLSVLVLFLFVTPVIGSSDWAEYGVSKNDNVYFYNKVSIKHGTDDIVQVWDKMVYSDEGREKDFQYYKKRGWLTEGRDKLSHQLTLNEINCKKGMNRILSLIEYEKDGGILSSNSFDKPNWVYIVPGSMMNILQEKVCK